MLARLLAVNRILDGSRCLQVALLERPYTLFLYKRRFENQFVGALLAINAGPCRDHRGVFCSGELLSVRDGAISAEHRRRRYDNLLSTREGTR